MPLIERIEELEKAPPLAGQGILGAHQPSTAPNEQPLIKRAVMKVGLGGLAHLRDAADHARRVACGDGTRRPQKD